MDYKNLAEVILEKVGGKDNVLGLTHCATRLRFNLKDEKKADTEALKKVKGVMGVVRNAGQYQVIIGSDVASVYRPLTELCDLQQDTAAKEADNRKLAGKIIDTITGIFTPILPAITAAGMLKAVLALLVVFGVVDKSAQSYQIINVMADAAFYFLPILLANSAAKKFNCNPYLAMMLGGMLLHPDFVNMVNTSKESGEAIRLFMIPITNASYSSSVIPIILSVWFMSFIEPIADRISPKAVKFFTKPLLTAIVAGIAALAVFGPVGYIIGNGIASAINTLESYCSWLVPTLLGGLFPLLVMTGTHYGIIPIGINNRMTMGYDTIVYPGNLASNVAQGAAALAVALKSKQSEIKQLASSAGITAVCGITEPALYGINLRFKTPLYASMIGGASGGLFMGLLRVKNYSGGSPGFLTLPSYIGESGLSDFYFACIGAVISVIVAFAASMLLYKDPVEASDRTTEENPEIKSQGVTNTNENKEFITIYAPVAGVAVSLKEVNDPTFSEEIIGKGAAVIPTEGRVVSPVRGTVTALFHTLHAIGITTPEGAEVLIHIGINTVKLEGKYFTAHIKQGDKVEVGTVLVDFELDKIKQEGYDMITPVVITNSTEYADVLHIDTQEVSSGDVFIKMIP